MCEEQAARQKGNKKKTKDWQEGVVALMVIGADGAGKKALARRWTSQIWGQSAYDPTYNHTSIIASLIVMLLASADCACNRIGAALG